MITEPTLKQLPVILNGQNREGIPRKYAAKNNPGITIPEILCITTFPPRECGIATYSQDLLSALNKKFNRSFTFSICALESETEIHFYKENISYLLNTDQPGSFTDLADEINASKEIELVMIQHEFGLFDKCEKEFIEFINSLIKPVVIVFHTVLPEPGEKLKPIVQKISGIAASIIVMTNSSANILVKDYGIPLEKITVIPHGTHLVHHSGKEFLKEKYQLSGKKVLSTFGLISAGKGIETTLDALPAIIEKNSDVIFLIIGKTHPSVLRQEGEKYREMLEHKVSALHIEAHVQFINSFLPLQELLDYLQLTDIYLFTSRDPAQAVSGTFSYAISCGCPVISTPIPHACEILKDDAGVIIDFDKPEQLSKAAISLLEDEQLRKKISSNGLHKMASTAWENAAIAHALLFEKIVNTGASLLYSIPEINLDQVKKMTTGLGIIQFSIMNQPDIDSGYTLDDNARAMIALCQHFKLTNEKSDLDYITIYLHFIQICLRKEGDFANYVDANQNFTVQNETSDLADSTGRAIWALGYLLSISPLLPKKLTDQATELFQKALVNVNKIHSTRAMAFIIKGLYYRQTVNKSIRVKSLIKQLANRLVQMYRHEADAEWRWFESYLTYANSLIPESLLLAWLSTGEPVYKEIARSSFDFLLTKIFTENSIRVISNKHWLHKEGVTGATVNGGEQPIDVAYTLLALGTFYEVYKEAEYKRKMDIAFNWFLGNNHLHQIIYNPCTGGCYDGLEENYVNLNQGAESTISYLMARLRLAEINQDEKDIVSAPILINSA
jgi:glycosyltransferase involved in cell wall biosynthesis